MMGGLERASEGHPLLQPPRASRCSQHAADSHASGQCSLGRLWATAVVRYATCTVRRGCAFEDVACGEAA
jgi:hypothetical protein